MIISLCAARTRHVCWRRSKAPFLFKAAACRVGSTPTTALACQKALRALPAPRLLEKKGRTLCCEANTKGQAFRRLPPVPRKNAAAGPERPLRQLQKLTVGVLTRFTRRASAAVTHQKLMRDPGSLPHGHPRLRRSAIGRMPSRGGGAAPTPEARRGVFQRSRRRARGVAHAKITQGCGFDLIRD